MLGASLTSEFCFHRQMDNQIQCLVRRVFNPVLIHTFSAHIGQKYGQSEQPSSNPALGFHFFISVLIFVLNIRLRRRQNPHRKTSQGRCQTGRSLTFPPPVRGCRHRWKRSFQSDCKRNIIFFQSVFSSLSVLNFIVVSWFQEKSSDNQRASPLSRLGFCLAIPR